jgi:hypothetical protein
MQAEIDEFLNPFAEWTKQSPPPFVCYILWCIGELPPADAVAMENQTPSLQRQYNQSGTWQEIVSAVIGINPRWSTKVKTMWRENLKADDCLCLKPLEFAKSLIEQNVHIR